MLFLTRTTPAWSVFWQRMLRPCLSSSQAQPGVSPGGGQAGLAVFTSNLGICGPTVERLRSSRVETRERREEAGGVMAHVAAWIYQRLDRESDSIKDSIFSSNN